MQITTIGLDIAKNVFQVHGIDAVENVIVRKQLRRAGAPSIHGTFATCGRSLEMSAHGGAGSTGRRNTGIKSLCWRFKLQGLTWSLV